MVRDRREPCQGRMDGMRYPATLAVTQHDAKMLEAVTDQTLRRAAEAVSGSECDRVPAGRAVAPQGIVFADRLYTTP